MMKLLIAVDGSLHARHAIEAAARLQREGVALQTVLVHVREPAVFFGELPPVNLDVLEQAHRDHQARLLDDAAAHADACGLKDARKEAAMGSAAQEIVRVANEHAVDQIVMGTRGRGSLGGLFIGSVAMRVVHLATVPVLLVK